MQKKPAAKPTPVDQLPDLLARADKLAEVADALELLWEINRNEKTRFRTDLDRNGMYEDKNGKRQPCYTDDQRALGEAAVKAVIKNYSVVKEAMDEATGFGCDSFVWTLIRNDIRPGVEGEGWSNWQECLPHFWEPFEWCERTPSCPRISFLEQVRKWEAAYREKARGDATEGNLRNPNVIELAEDRLNVNADGVPDGMPATAGYDAFISHATEDKQDLVRPLADELTRIGLRVWYDEFELKVGDSLRRSIDKGIANCRYGIVILSAAFFAKNWAQYELDGLTARKMSEQLRILPIWHRIEKQAVLNVSPSLADIVALKSSSLTVQELAEALAEKIRSRTKPCDAQTPGAIDWPVGQPEWADKYPFRPTNGPNENANPPALLDGRDLAIIRRAVPEFDPDAADYRREIQLAALGVYLMTRCGRSDADLATLTWPRVIALIEEAAQPRAGEGADKEAEDAADENRMLVWSIVRRTILWLLVLAVLECVPVYCAGRWGEGKNLWQKSLQSWPFFVAVFAACAIVYPFLLGRKRLRLIKLWKGDDK